MGFQSAFPRLNPEGLSLQSLTGTLRGEADSLGDAIRPVEDGVEQR